IMSVSMSSSSANSDPPLELAKQHRVHLNHAGASPSPKQVTDRVLEHLRLETELGGYAAQDFVEQSGALRNVYENIATLINAKSENEIALVESATVGWTRAFYAMVQHEELRLRRERERDLNKTKQQRIRRVILDGTTSTGLVDLTVLQRMLSGQYQYEDTNGESTLLDPTDIAIVCITHIPTNSGIVNDVESIGEQIEAFNQHQQQGKNARSLWYLVDACQSVGQLEIDVEKIRCHALVATGRKYLRAPRGTGFLYISEELLEQGVMPSHVDHYGCPVSSVPLPSSYQDGVQLQQETVIQYKPRESASRFEFWESSVSNRLGLGEAVHFAMEQGMPQVARSILELSALLRSRLSKIPGLMIHHENTTKCGIVTFQCSGLESRAVVNALWEKGFELSVVPATSTPMDSSRTGVPDLVRASLTYVTTEEEIEAFCSALVGYLTEQKTRTI
ncbi:MAG: hypothetical protein SGARI_000708, partial [Bacillariaceae sp.]